MRFWGWVDQDSREGQQAASGSCGACSGFLRNEGEAHSSEVLLLTARCASVAQLNSDHHGIIAKARRYPWTPKATSLLSVQPV